MNVICIGELMVEMTHMGDGVYRKTYSGDTFNTAYYMRCYAPHWHIDYGTSLGTSADDKGAIDFIQSHTIGTDTIDIHTSRTIGLLIFDTDNQGEKNYRYWRSDSAVKTYFDRVRDFSNYDIVYLSGITSAVTDNRNNLIESITTTKQNNKDVLVAYDFNHRRQLWSPSEGRDLAQKIMPLCDTMKISDEELPWLFGDDMTLQKLSAMAPHAEIIFTKGPHGSERWLGGVMTHSCPAVAVDTIVDLSAAGDSFIACYLWQRSVGGDVMLALQYASKVSSAVLGYRGSTAPQSQLPNFS